MDLYLGDSCCVGTLSGGTELDCAAAGMVVGSGIMELGFRPIFAAL